jgi:hypothetical protein
VLVSPGVVRINRGYKNKVLANRLDWKNFQITAKFKYQLPLKLVVFNLFGVMKSSKGHVLEGPLLEDLLRDYVQKGYITRETILYRTVMERPRSIRRSSGVTIPGPGGGPRCRK